MPALRRARTVRLRDRTTRKARLRPDPACAQARGSEERLAAALEGLYVGRDNKALLVADAGTIISLNRLATELCGYRAEDLVGKPLATGLFEEPAESGRDPAVTTVRWEASLRTVGGTLIPVEVVREPLGSRNPTAMVYAIRDLRERREIAAERAQKDHELRERERQLRLQNVRFDTAINNMPQGLAMLDGEGRLLVSNQRFGELYGLAPAALRPGTTLAELNAAIAAGGLSGEIPAGPPPLDEPGNEAPLMQRLSNGRILAVARRPMADGGLVVTTDDITERERDRARLEEYNAKLEASNGELQHFAYVASHDLQEPLRKIETFADRIRKRHGAELSSEVAMPLERIQDAAQRMRRLINDLLGYARLSNASANVRAIDLGDILREVLSDLHVRIEETGARVVADGLAVVEADPTQMRQLLQNLIANALKFSRPGVAPVVTVRAAGGPRPDGSEAIAISVTDNGIGFDNRHKEKIFQIFQRLHGRAEYEGSGVGLATCRKIAERHRGSIDADGRPGEGATFTVTLPVAQPRPYPANRR